MYRRSKFLEILIEIRQEMAREADFDTDLFAEMVRSGAMPSGGKPHAITETPASAKKETSAKPRKTVGKR